MIWKIAKQFLLIFFGGVAGGIPRRRGSGKAAGFEAWGKAFPLPIKRCGYLFWINELSS
jgi:hypothetical protein